MFGGMRRAIIGSRNQTSLPATGSTVLGEEARRVIERTAIEAVPGHPSNVQAERAKAIAKSGPAVSKYAEFSRRLLSTLLYAIFRTTKWRHDAVPSSSAPSSARRSL